MRYHGSVELTPLRYFRAIAQAGHMTRAAEKLGVTQPALSAMLKKLEREVGTDLVVRTGRGVELSEAGRVFLTHADDSVRSADQAVASVRQLLGLERGTLRLGGGATAITYLLPPVVSQLRRKHPGLRFFVREAGSSAVAQSVLSGELDVGIVTLPITLPGADDLVRVPLVTDEFRLIVPTNHRLRKSDSFRWKDLQGEPVVAFEAGSAVREVIDRAARDTGVTLDIVMELRSIESIKQMVQAGIGVGFVSRFAVSEREGLACRDTRLTRQLALIRRRDRDPSPAAAAFEKAIAASVPRTKAKERA
jgi:DNA-binding transcriptional LysR family regulator